MKKIWGLFMIIVLALLIVGCTSESSDNTKEDKQSKHQVQKVTKKHEVGEIVTFGSYRQLVDSTEKQPIEWYVLSDDGNQMLLYSKYILDLQQFYSERTSVSWKDNLLREWLNNDFYDMAFTDDEKESIILTKLNNIDYIVGDYTTEDRVFLLAYKDLINSEYGFSTNHKEKSVNRRSAPTPYIVERMKIEFDHDISKNKTRTSYEKPSYVYALRSREDKEYRIDSVDSLGFVSRDNYLVNDSIFIRPAIYVKSGYFDD